MKVKIPQRSSRLQMSTRTRKKQGKFRCLGTKPNHQPIRRVNGTVMRVENLNQMCSNFKNIQVSPVYVRGDANHLSFPPTLYFKACMISFFFKYGQLPHLHSSVSLRMSSASQLLKRKSSQLHSNIATLRQNLQSFFIIIYTTNVFQPYISLTSLRVIHVCQQATLCSLQNYVPEKVIL